MPTTRKQTRVAEEQLAEERKKSRVEKHPEPQTKIGSILNVEDSEDLRRQILSHLSDKAAMNACLVSKRAYNSISSYSELMDRCLAAAEDGLACCESLKKFCAKLPNSTNRLRDALVKVADEKEECRMKQIYYRELHQSCKALSYWRFRWAAEKKVKEMAAVIEKQAFQIEALIQLYKAK
jgi:DNA-binding transcriptional ArsR family regulator